MSLLNNNKLQKVQMAMLADDVQNKFNGLESSLAQIVQNVKFFGAKGDGVADDTAAIQAAIDYVKNNYPTSVFNADWKQNGGVVYLPAGTYKITSPLYLYEGIHLKGQSMDSVKIAAGSVSTYAITNRYIDTVAGYRNVTIENLSVTGSEIYLLQGYNSNVKNVSVYNSPTYGLLLQQTTFTKIDNFKAFNCGTGIGLIANAGVGPCTSTYFTNVWISNCGTGITLDGNVNWIDTVSFTNLIIEYCTSNPIIVYGGTQDNKGISFNHLHMEGNSSYIILKNTSALFSDVQFDNLVAYSMVVQTPTQAYNTTISFKNVNANIYLQPSVTSTIYYENIYQINNISTAKYVSLDITKSNVYTDTDGTNILKYAYQSLKGVSSMADGTKAVFDVVIYSDAGYWVGRCYFSLNTSINLVAQISSVITVTQNSGGTIALTAGNTNPVFNIKLVA